MSVTLTISSKSGLTETTTIDGVGSHTFRIDDFDQSIKLTSSSTPDVTKCAADALSLTAGAATIDLTSLTAPSGAVDATGLELRWARFINTGSAAMTISEGGTNGYAIGGQPIVVQPGGIVTVYFKTGLGAVASGDKTLDVAGTGTETLKYELVFGTAA